MSEDITMNSAQLKDLQKEFDGFNKRSAKGLQDIAEEYARKLREEVQQNASGRPGPRVETGAYRAEIEVVEEKHGGEVANVVVYTEHPEGPRLEFGFIGVDAMGRHYDQPPFPHWQPAIDVIWPEYIQAIQDEIPRWFKG